MQVIKEFLEKKWGVCIVPLAYITKPLPMFLTLIIKTFPSPKDKMMNHMLHFKPDEKSKYINEEIKLFSGSYTEDCLTGNMTVYDILNAICKETNLHLFMKAFKVMRDG